MSDTKTRTGTGQYITVRIHDQLFGLPIAAINEVFVPEQITRVKLAPREVEGVLNLRGRIVTMIDVRALLRLPPRQSEPLVAAGIDYRGESYGLIIDAVGEVLTVDALPRQPNPANIDARWAELITGVYRVGGELMLVLDVDRALGAISPVPAAA
jgi:purine-binding chemotaxis protein CheW